MVVYLDDQAQGDLCPTCLAQGASFVRTRLQTQLSDRISSHAA
ncbi:hypothetical protein NIES2104_35430 [Leptolyngbya sp. NIES-2104]|nr:hypothetical protein NIES2104_35430 [Leptolyngbya sp. NIES-2104]